MWVWRGLFFLFFLRFFWLESVDWQAVSNSPMKNYHQRIVGFFAALPAVFASFVLSAQADQEGAYTYDISSGTHAVITDYDDRVPPVGGALAVPAELGGLPVTELGTEAFSLSSGITSVSLPNTLTKIGEAAFRHSMDLAFINIPASVTVIGDQAFFGNAKLSSVILNEGLETVGAESFELCRQLTSIMIPSSVASIGAQAFLECSSLGRVTILSGSTTLGSGAFQRCLSLTSLRLPEGMTSIEDQFSFCSGLVRLSLPSTLGTIGSNAFNGCTALEYLVVPDGVGMIGPGAFADCSGLTHVTLSSSTTMLVASFTQCPALKTLLIEGMSAPAQVGPASFVGVGSGFKPYITSDKKLSEQGQVSWGSLNLTEINPGLDPVGYWLVGQGFYHGYDASGDPLENGCSLLVSYALGLEPRKPETIRLPVAEVVSFPNEVLSLSYPITQPGVSYGAEASLDLDAWSSEGITYSDDGTTQTASVPAGFGERFIRLVVTKDPLVDVDQP